MAIEVKIPPMGESISSGILAKWHVKNGDAVKKDQPLFELETDKITSEGHGRGGRHHHAQGRGRRRGEDRPGRRLDRGGSGAAAPAEAAGASRGEGAG